MRVRPTDHIATGVAPAGAPAGKKAPLKHITVPSGAHRHGKQILPGPTGTGPGIDTRGLMTNAGQIISGDGANLHGQMITTHTHNFPPLLTSLLSPTLQPTSLRKCTMFVAAYIALARLHPFLASPISTIPGWSFCPNLVLSIPAPPFFVSSPSWWSSRRHGYLGGAKLHTAACR